MLIKKSDRQARRVVSALIDRGVLQLVEEKRALIEYMKTL